MPTRKPIYRRPGVIVAGVLVVLAIAVAAILSIMRGRGDRGYEAMQAAMQEGDCAAALETRDANFRYFNAEQASDAYRVTFPCTIYLEASDLQESGSYPDALLVYVEFFDILPQQRGQALTGKAQAQMEQLFAEHEPVELVDAGICENVSALQIIDDFRSADDAIPRLHFGCGDFYAQQGKPDIAASHYGQVSARHELSDAAQAALAGLDISAPVAEEGIALPPPVSVGTVGGSNALLVIQNASPQTLTFSFSGPTIASETVPLCPSCTVYSTPPAACPPGGPVTSLELPPGTYSVQATTSGLEAPFFGNWTLLAGTEYAYCFFVVEVP